MKLAQIEVSLVDKMGTDLSVVNAARVSFDKESEWEHETSPHEFGPITVGYHLSDRDRGLIGYLAKHGHWTPFAHPHLSLRIKAPIFVARQLVKHQVGLVWNEVSRRYVDSEPEFYLPDVWRGKPKNAKQGSSDDVVTHLQMHDIGLNSWWGCEVAEAMFNQTEASLSIYNAAITAGVAPEMARMVLPLNTMTEWWWTGSLMAFGRICKQRLDPHAQKETQDVAVLINNICQELFPVAWSALMNKE